MALLVLHARVWGKLLTGAAALLFAAGSGASGPAGAADGLDGASLPPGPYVVDLVATTSHGVDMNDFGDVAGTSYPDPGCGSACLPPLETVVWRGGSRIVLPPPPGFTSITVTGINNDGWVSGFAGSTDTGSHAVVWRPGGNGYAATDLGVLPGTLLSSAVGIDDLGRVVGWSRTANFPYSYVPFVWTEAEGMVDLTAAGFPNEPPLGISPGGTVATYGFWYHLDESASVTPLTPAPVGYAVQNAPVAINDAGDQARFLVRLSGQNLVYPYRYHRDGAWQQISPVGTGHLASYGVGGINDAGDVTVTVLSAGQIAYGPDGLAQPLAPLVSPSYGGGPITRAGTMNRDGRILVEMIIGQSGRRLVELVPAAPCKADCVRVSDIQMWATGPGFCDQGTVHAEATLTVTDPSGVSQSGVWITGHFFDDYWLDETVVGVTDAFGQVTFAHDGPPCVGAIAFLATVATRRTFGPSLQFDRTAGLLTESVIPQTRARIGR